MQLAHVKFSEVDAGTFSGSRPYHISDDSGDVQFHSWFDFRMQIFISVKSVPLLLGHIYSISSNCSYELKLSVELPFYCRWEFFYTHPYWFLLLTYIFYDFTAQVSWKQVQLSQKLLFDNFNNWLIPHFGYHQGGPKADQETHTWTDKELLFHLNILKS